MIKAVILDLDNTLYNHDLCHAPAKAAAIKELSIKSGISEELLNQQYLNISKSLKNELPGTASSFNRFIYFRKLVEFFNLKISASEIYQVYYDYFRELISIRSGVREFLVFLKSNGIKTAVLTDFTIDVQFEKINMLQISDLIDIVITSEETGINKPSVKAFLYCLDRLKEQPENVIMIGDSLEKDIQPAVDLGMFAFHYNSDCKLKINDKYAEFSNFFGLLNLFTDIKNETDNLVYLSRKYGQRFDLVQGTGGNISVKTDDFMLIKSSGIHMSDVSVNTGYASILNGFLKNDILKNEYKDLKDYVVFKKEIPSMETYMHSFLKKYTVHIHPLQSLIILVSQDYRKILQELFPEALVVDYKTPGIDLSKEIFKTYNNHNVIFMANHGIIITSDSMKELEILLEGVMLKCEEYVGFSGTFSGYKTASLISDLIYNKTGKRKYVYYSDVLVYDTPNIFPDKIIFCGTDKKIVKYNNIDELKAGLENLPPAFMYGNNIYIVSDSINKCRDIEEVLRAVKIIRKFRENPVEISRENIDILQNLEAEKYRKNL